MKNERNLLALAISFASIITLVVSIFWILPIPQKTNSNNIFAREHLNSVSCKTTYTETIPVWYPSTPNYEITKNNGNETYQENSISSNYEELSEGEVLLLEKVTYAEAGICSIEAQRGVAATVLARATEKRIPIDFVIFESGQFSSAIDGKIYLITVDGNIEVTNEMAKNSKTEEAVKEAIHCGAEAPITTFIGGEPLYFYSKSGISDEELEARASVGRYYEIDGIVFYREWPTNP